MPNIVLNYLFVSFTFDPQTNLFGHFKRKLFLYGKEHAPFANSCFKFSHDPVLIETQVWGLHQYQLIINVGKYDDAFKIDVTDLLASVRHE